MTEKKQNRRWVLFLGVWFQLPCLCMAATVDKKPATELFNAGYLLQVFGSLLLVLGCLFGVIYLLKRLNGLSMVHGNTPVKVLSSIRIGAREKILLLDAGGQQMLVGVAPGNIRTLKIFDQPISPIEPVKKTDFKTLLMKSTEERSP